MTNIFFIIRDTGGSKEKYNPAVSLLKQFFSQSNNSTLKAKIPVQSDPNRSPIRSGIHPIRSPIRNPILILLTAVFSFVCDTERLAILLISTAL